MARNRKTIVKSDSRHKNNQGGGALRGCFVASPIGDAGTQTRRHADAVLKRIVRPALDRCGFYDLRIDHRPPPGSIPNKIVEYLRDAELCIAIVTGENANVMFELGVRQAWDLPVIQMAKKSKAPLPFDIRSRYTVFYSLTTDRTIKAAIAELCRVIEGIDGIGRNAHDGKVPSYSMIFGESMAKLGQRHSMDAVFEAKRAAIDYLRVRLHQILAGIEADYELQQPSARIEDAKPHYDYVRDVFASVRTTCATFDLISKQRAVNPHCRRRCIELLQEIKMLATMADEGLEGLFPRRGKKINTLELKSFVHSLISNVDELCSKL